MVDTPQYDESGMPVYPQPDYTMQPVNTAPQIASVPTTFPAPTSATAAPATTEAPKPAAQLQAEQTAAAVAAALKQNENKDAPSDSLAILKNPIVLLALGFGAVLLMRGK